MPVAKKKSKDQKTQKNAHVVSLEELFPGKEEDFIAEARSMFKDLFQDIGPWDGPRPTTMTVVDSEGEPLFFCFNKIAISHNRALLDRLIRSNGAIRLSID